MRSWLPLLAFLIAVPAAAFAQPASGSRVSAPISDVRYDVTANAAATRQRQLHVRMSFSVTGTEPVLLSLPAWTPGAYDISNFARWISAFDPQAAGKPLQWDKVDPDTWRIHTAGAKAVTLDFDVIADSLDNAMSWTRDDFALFNGTNLFFYPEGRSLDFPATVNVVTESGWLVATGMPPGSAPRTYSAQSYHDLVDFPFFVGRFDYDSAQVAGKWIRLATYPAGILTGAGRAEVWTGIRKIIPAQVAVFQDMPFSTYTVMQIVDSGYGGASGLEHQNSHVDVVSPYFLGNPVMFSLYAHEIFHAWNVKRLRPAAMWPYRYDAPQPTEWLWLSEGVTDYYADVSEVRAGIIDSIGFFALTSDKITEVSQARPVALEDASLSTWISPADETALIYYPKGSLAGLMLDIMIRDASDNARSLDDALRELYRTAWKAGSGFTGEQFWRAVSTAAGGKSFADFNARYIDGREPYPWSSTLPLAGMRIVTDTARFPVLGVRTILDTGGVRVTSVDDNSPAEQAGIKAGDILLGVGDIAVEDQEFGAKFRARYSIEGAALPLRIRRDGRTLSLNGKVKLRVQVTQRVVTDAGASAKAVRIRTGILHGTPGPR